MCGSVTSATASHRSACNVTKRVAPWWSLQGEERMSGRGLGRALVMAALAAAVGGAGSAQAQETRAALDPALVEGRGAQVAFAEQEAEHAATTGERLSASSTGDIASYDP